MGRCGHGSPVALLPPPAYAPVLHTSPHLFTRPLRYSSSILRLLQLVHHEPSPIRTIVAAPSPNLAPHCSTASGDVVFCIVLTPIVELGGSWDAVVMTPLSLSPASPCLRTCSPYLPPPFHSTPSLLARMLPSAAASPNLPQSTVQRLAMHFFRWFWDPKAGNRRS